MRRGARRRTIVLALAQAFVALPGLAEYRHRAVVLSAAHARDSLESELEARLRGELTAAGIDVIVVQAPEGVDVRDAVESSARELSPSAVIGLREPPGKSTEQTNIEVWISDRLSGRTLVQRAQFSAASSNQIALLAVQVSELFKARLGLLWIEPTHPAEREPESKPENTALPAPAPKPELAPPPVHSRSSPAGARLLVGAGFGLMHQMRESISAWSPTLQIGLEPGVTSWAAPAFRASFGFTPGHSEIERTGASASVTQAWGFAQGYLRFAPNSPVQPALSLGGGIYSVNVAGNANAPETTHAERTWSAAATLGLGLWIPMNDAFAFFIEGQGLSTWSKTVVRIRGEEAATFGFPAAIISASWVALLGPFHRKTSAPSP